MRARARIAPALAQQIGAATDSVSGLVAAAAAAAAGLNLASREAALLSAVKLQPPPTAPIAPLQLLREQQMLLQLPQMPLVLLVAPLALPSARCAVRGPQVEAPAAAAAAAESAADTAAEAGAGAGAGIGVARASGSIEARAATTAAMAAMESAIESAIGHGEVSVTLGRQRPMRRRRLLPLRLSVRTAGVRRNASVHSCVVTGVRHDRAKAGLRPGLQIQC